MDTDNSGAYRKLVVDQHKEIITKLTRAEKISFLRHSLYEWMMISAAISVLILAYQQHKSAQQMVRDMAFIAGNSELQLKVAQETAAKADAYRVKSDKEFNDAVTFDQKMQKAREKREVMRAMRDEKLHNELANVYRATLGTIKEVHDKEKR